MKKCFLFLFSFLLCCGINYEVMSQTQNAQSKPNATQATGLLRHVVLFKFKDSSTPAQVKSVEEAFTALPGKINTIVGLEWGTNMSPENLEQGYTHCFLVTFKNTADRDAYLPHPAHKEFGKILGPHLDKVLVIDFVGEK